MHYDFSSMSSARVAELGGKSNRSYNGYQHDAFCRTNTVGWILYANLLYFFVFTVLGCYRFFTESFLCAALSIFGISTVSTPSLTSAFASSTSISAGSKMDRENEPNESSS